jgi:quercetin dioxygenase-like cupin family protein
MSSATYRTLLRTPGAAAFFLTAAAGRVGIAMTSLGIVWLVHARTGSYATAGLVTGGFAVAEAVAGPQLAALIDRHGQSRVLPPALLAHAAAVAALLALADAGAPDWLLAAGGVLAGATIPQLGALSAARWAALLGGARAAALPTAFALESLANELAFLAGPALVAVLGASGHPAAGTMAAAALVISGGLCFAAQRRTAPPAAGGARPPRAGRSLLRPGFAALAGVSLAIGVFFGAMQISVTAFAVTRGAAGSAAALFTVSSGASLLAGWLYGLRRWRMAPRVQLALAAAGLAVGCLPLLAAASPLELGGCLALTGLAIPLVIVLCTVLAEAAVDRAVLTQAFVWLNSASAAGSAAGAAAAGWAAGGYGARAGFAVAALAAGVMAVLAVASLRALTRGRRDQPPGESQKNGTLATGKRPPVRRSPMPVTIISTATSPVLNVLGEELRPLTPAAGGLSVQVFDTCAPGEAPGEAGPPVHRHPWDEIYVVLAGRLEVFDGEAWSEAPAGTCVTVPARQWHAYRNGTADCRFLTITGPGRAREFFENSAAELTTPPDLAAALALAARHDVEAVPPGSPPPAADPRGAGR